MKDRLVATRYARALLGALPDPAAQDRAGAFLDVLVAGIAGSEPLRAFLLDPAITAPKKTEALSALARTQAAPDNVVRFLATVASHGRLSHLASIARVYGEERERAQGIVTATLIAAAPLPSDLRARAEAALGRISGKKVNLRVEVDPALLGGAVSTLGSMVYDGSIRTRLAHLRARLGEE